jgi:hypothetical protein
MASATKNGWPLWPPGNTDRPRLRLAEDSDAGPDFCQRAERLDHAEVIAMALLGIFSGEPLEPAA